MSLFSDRGEREIEEYHDQSSSSGNSNESSSTGSDSMDE